MTFNLFDLMNSDEFDGVVRHIMTSFGGAVTATGLVSSDQWTQVTGAVVVLLGILWSIANKKYMRSQQPKGQ
jgi:hypothetical protein